MPSDILIIKPSSFGDIVHGLQITKSIREQMPGCRISWVVREIFAPLVESCLDVDEHFVLHRHGGVSAFGDLISQVRRKRYDIVIDMQGLARSGVLTLAAKAERKLGRSDAREFSGLAYGEKALLPSAGENFHAVEILMEFLPLLGLERKLCGAPVFKAPESFSFDVVAVGEKPILMFPESRRPEKNWGGFTELTSRLLAMEGGRKVVWAGSAEMEPEAPVDSGQFINLTGKTRLDELPSLMKRAGLVISNDSGPMHLAAALGVPVLAVFGPTPPERFGPYPLSEKRNRVVAAPSGDLSQLGAEPVFEAAVEMLSA